MKKTSLIIGLFISTALLSGCGESERIAELEDQNYEYQREIANLQGIIEDCNTNIDDAKSYIGESYDDMEYALDYLQNCEY